MRPPVPVRHRWDHPGRRSILIHYRQLCARGCALPFCLYLSSANETTPDTAPILLHYRHLRPRGSTLAFRPHSRLYWPENWPGFHRFWGGLGGAGMAENLDVLNTTVSLLIKAALLAARFSGRVRQRYLNRSPTRREDRSGQHRASRVHRDAGHCLSPEDCGVVAAAWLGLGEQGGSLPISQEQTADSLLAVGQTPSEHWYATAPLPHAICFGPRCRRILPLHSGSMPA